MDIRPARPDDSGPIAAMLYSSGPELFDFIYDTATSTALDFIRYEFASGKGFGGWRNVTVAVIEGKAVGTGCFYSRRDYLRLEFETTLNMLRFFGWRLPPVALRGLHFGSVIKLPSKGELYLSHFGVDETQRGRGIGRKMLQHKIAAARQQGFRAFGLDVATTNPRAEALYRGVGLEITVTKAFSGRREGYPVPGYKKMELHF
jgi:ribosomal protein S18 acetylase RimI-like enzyme